MSEKPTKEDLKQKVTSLQNECAELTRTIGMLRDSENKYRTFFENSLDAVVFTNPILLMPAIPPCLKSR
jgi:hypothetical protein